MNTMLPQFLEGVARMGCEPDWWPAQNEYEVLLGAVLTQNTNWRNVERTFQNFKRPVQPETVLHLSDEALFERIRPSGFYRRKARTIQALTRWYLNMETPETGALRKELLAIGGIGKETADSILNYGFNRAVLVIDAYTRRVATRFGLRVPKEYDALQRLLQDALPPDAASLAAFHAGIVELAKRYCRKNPLCAECPLHHMCAKRATMKASP